MLPALARRAAKVIVPIMGTIAAAGCAAPSDDDDDTAESADAYTTSLEARALLYPGERAPTACDAGNEATRVRCLLRSKYAGDPAARDLALDLFDKTGGVAGLLPARTMDGEYRGTIQLVPELPDGQYRKHLVFVRDGMRDIESFFASLRRVAPSPITYAYRGVDVRFFRSVGRTTPSAFVEGGNIAYNVVGSLNASASSVRETLFHEIFHQNDFARNEWSRILAPTVNAIAARCGTNVTCLAPYAPTDTKVRGGTYYAFQPGNGPLTVEYSAELAIRYFEEQRARLQGTARPGKPFKCGPPENAWAWGLLRDTFFGGADLVPPCP